MISTGVVISDRYIEHDTGPHHPESSERIRAINQRIADTDLSEHTQLIEPQTVDLSLVQQVHTPGYIDELRDAWPDIVVQRESRYLLPVLFPKMTSYFCMPWRYFGPLSE